MTKPERITEDAAWYMFNLDRPTIMVLLRDGIRWFLPEDVLQILGLDYSHLEAIPRGERMQDSHQNGIELDHGVISENAVLRLIEENPSEASRWLKAKLNEITPILREASAVKVAPANGTRS